MTNSKDEQYDEQAWLDSLPPAVRVVAQKYPPADPVTAKIHCWRSSQNPLFHYVIKSFSEPDAAGLVTVTLVHGHDSTLPGVATFGQDPAQLTLCDCGKWQPPTDLDKQRTKAKLDLFKRSRS